MKYKTLISIIPLNQENTGSINILTLKKLCSFILFFLEEMKTLGREETQSILELAKP